MYDFRFYKRAQQFYSTTPNDFFFILLRKKKHFFLFRGYIFHSISFLLFRFWLRLYLFAHAHFLFSLPIYVDVCSRSVSFCFDSHENILIIVVYLVSGYNGYINTLSFCPLTIRSTRYDSFHFPSFNYYILSKLKGGLFSFIYSQSTIFCATYLKNFSLFHITNYMV